MSAPELDLIELLMGACKGQCVFYREGLCAIHATSFKPTQCRTAYACCDSPDYPDNFEVAKLWDTDDARALVRDWQMIISRSAA